MTPAPTDPNWKDNVVTHPVMFVLWTEQTETTITVKRVRAWNSMRIACGRSLMEGRRSRDCTLKEEQERGLEQEKGEREWT